MTHTNQIHLGDLIAQFRAQSKRAVAREDARHAAWWRSRLGTEPLTALTTDRILRELDVLAGYGRSPSTVTFYVRFLRRVCAWAVRERILSTDPCAAIALPKQPKPTLRVLTPDEEARLCAALGSPYDLWVKIALETGLKLSEQFSLRWRDVDLTRATALLPDPSSGAAFALTLSPTAVALLQQLRHTHPPSMWCFPDLKTPNRPVNVHSFLSWRWGRAVEEAGIPPITWKDLRTTCGVRLSAQGLPVDDVVARMRQVGNKRAYLYRCTAEKRAPKVTPEAAPSIYGEKIPGELSAILARDLRAHPLSFEEAARLYAVHHLGHRASRRQFERIARQFYQPWTARPLESLTRREIRAWYLDLAHIPIYANKALTCLRALINWAIDLELITCANPALRIKRFPAPPRERFLSTDELQRMITGLPLLPPKIRAYLLILLLTGARSGEARQMRWKDLDPVTRIWVKPKTKSGKAHRVPLPLQVMEALEKVPRINEWVFPGTRGRSWSKAVGHKLWTTIRRRWGFDDVTLHDLRRTAASHLAIHGENLPVIQGMLGHHSLSPTAIYARLNTQALDRALQDQADRLGSLYAPATWLPPARPPADEGPATPPPVIIEATATPEVARLPSPQEEEGEDKWPG